jgi:anti-sigma factor RsiW
VSRDLACREVVELLNGYLDDALPADVRTAVEAHLAGCDGCTMVLDEFRQTIAMTGMLVEEQHVAADQREILLAAFRGWTLA